MKLCISSISRIKVKESFTLLLWASLCNVMLQYNERALPEHEYARNNFFYSEYTRDEDLLILIISGMEILLGKNICKAIPCSGTPSTAVTPATALTSVTEVTPATTIMPATSAMTAEHGCQQHKVHQ
jgi:hypothetical protein